jgi:hypothetical protein
MREIERADNICICCLCHICSNKDCLDNAGYGPECFYCDYLPIIKCNKYAKGGLLMKEIKYRVWSKEYKEMYYSELIEDKRKFGFICYIDSGYSIDSFIFMQYTGLKDVNNKEIYECSYNISKKDQEIRVVGFKNGKFGFFIYDLSDSGFYEFVDIDHLNYDKMDLSKNIYENPIEEYNFFKLVKEGKIDING